MGWGWRKLNRLHKNEAKTKIHDRIPRWKGKEVKFSVAVTIWEGCWEGTWAASGLQGGQLPAQLEAYPRLPFPVPCPLFPF